jgi:hypothetical protein
MPTLKSCNPAPSLGYHGGVEDPPKTPKQDARYGERYPYWLVFIITAALMFWASRYNGYSEAEFATFLLLMVGGVPAWSWFWWCFIDEMGGGCLFWPATAIAAILLLATIW